uniref:Uncharacterized protein n=1 Tax=Schizaphis graminum TaxID=13262 RepID=A0A2S2NNA0_SCHGA
MVGGGSGGGDQRPSAARVSVNHIVTTRRTNIITKILLYTVFKNSPGYTRQLLLLVTLTNVFMFTTNLVLQTDTTHRQYYSTNYKLCVLYNLITVSSQQSKRFTPSTMILISKFMAIRGNTCLVIIHSLPIT